MKLLLFLLPVALAAVPGHTPGHTPGHSPAHAAEHPAPHPAHHPADQVHPMKGKEAHANNCRPLKDYGPVRDCPEYRDKCRTSFKKHCEKVDVEECLTVTEVKCEVELFTDCSLGMVSQDSVDNEMFTKTKPIKKCHRLTTTEYHDKTVYDCKEKKKQQCETLWEMNEYGEKIWAGTSDDCNDVAWTECDPVTKKVPFQVPYYNCTDNPVKYWDCRNKITQEMTMTFDCKVEKRAVCEPVQTKKCAWASYQKCSEVPETKCDQVEIWVPCQDELHKQFCLLDEGAEDDIHNAVSEALASPR